MDGEYRPRVADAAVRKALQSAGVVLIEGPNGCGKATTAAQVARSYLHLRYPWHRDGSPALVNPAAMGAGAAPRLFSECQGLSGLVETAAEAAHGRSGQYIFTQSGAWGPVVPAGVRRLRMRPMSLFESGESTGAVSLAGLFAGEFREAEAEYSADEAAFSMVRGGWPGALDLEEEAALRDAGAQMGTQIGLKLGRVRGAGGSPDSISAFMRALARHAFTCAPVSVIRASTAEEGVLLSEQQIRQYLRALSSACLIDDIPAWHPVVRTRTLIRGAPRRQLADPSLACAVMNLSPADLVWDVQRFSRMFKSMCARDLRVYTEALDGEVLHYRDASRLRADAVILLPDGRWGALAAELDVLGSEPAAARLLKLRDKVDTEQMGEPSFLAILTLSGAAYRRRDGVLVIPLAVLGP